MAFENLNSLEQLHLQNNKLVRIPEEIMEPVMDTLRVVDIMGELPLHFRFVFIFLPAFLSLSCCAASFEHMDVKS